MSKATPALCSFAQGELSPKLNGRFDHERYFSGCKTLTNFIATPQGAAMSRPGTEYITAAKESDKPCRMIPFEFSTDQAYVIEFGDEYIRFFAVATDRTLAPLLQRGSVYELVSPYSESELAELMWAQSADIMYLCHPDHAPRELHRLSADDSAPLWEIVPFDYQDGPWLDENEVDAGTISESITIAVDATVKGATGVTITASATIFQGNDDDIGRLVRIRHELKWGCIKITDHISTTQAEGTITEDFLFTTPSKHWRLGAWSPVMGWPHCCTFHEQRLWFARTDTRPQTLWASVVGDFANFCPNVEVAGANYVSNGEFNDGSENWLGTTGWTFTTGTAKHTTGTTKLYQSIAVNDGHRYRITYTITARTTGSVVSSMAFSSPVTFSTRSTNGTFQEYFTAANPGGAAINLGFTPTTDFDGEIDDVIIEDIADILVTGDDSGLNYTISSDTIDTITWLLSKRTLVVGTTGGIYSIKSHGDAPITPTNVDATRENAYPCADKIRPVLAGNTILYAQKGRRKIRQLIYDIQSDNLDAADLTLYADHITDGLIKEIALQNEPFHILWAVTDDGYLMGMTYEPKEKVSGWHRQATPLGMFESIAVAPGADEDEVWFLVKRNLTVGDVRYVERFKPHRFTSLYDYFGVDCGIGGDAGSVQAAITGLDHLEGEEVAILGDMALYERQSVASGQVTLNPTARYYMAGLHFNCVLQTMNLEAGAQMGTAQGKVKRVIDVTVRVYRSGSLPAANATAGLDFSPCLGYTTEEELSGLIYISSDGTTVLESPGSGIGGDIDDDYTAVEVLEPLDLRNGQLYSGDVRAHFPKGWDTAAYIYILRRQPLPLTILAIMPTVYTVER